MKAKDVPTKNQGRRRPIAPDDDVSAEKFGNLPNADHFVISDEAAAARDGSLCGLVNTDKATMLVGNFPRAAKSTEDLVSPFHQFVGSNDEVKRLYSDGAHEVASSARLLH